MPTLAFVTKPYKKIFSVDTFDLYRHFDNEFLRKHRFIVIYIYLFRLVYYIMFYSWCNSGEMLFSECIDKILLSPLGKFLCGLVCKMRSNSFLWNSFTPLFVSVNLKQFSVFLGKLKQMLAMFSNSSVFPSSISLGSISAATGILHW